MAEMKFKFDDKQQYQLDAISSVVNLFDGQPKDADKLQIALRGRVDLPADDGDQAALELTADQLAQEVIGTADWGWNIAGENSLTLESPRGNKFQFRRVGS